MDPGQILWTTPSPPNLQTFFFLFQNFQFLIFMIFFFIFGNMGPYRSKISKRYPPYNFYPISGDRYDK